MTEKYLEFPIPEGDVLSNFSSTVSFDNKNRIHFPAAIKKIFTQEIFDILNFHDKDIPYMKIIPREFYTNSHKIFLQEFQEDAVDDAKLKRFEEYNLRAHTLVLNKGDRLTIPVSYMDQLGLQSQDKIHMVVSYPSITIYKTGDYKSLLQQYGNTKKYISS